MTKTKKQDRDAVLKFSEHKRKRVDELEADVDALFQLPLPEFTGARNALAAHLKKSGRGDEAAHVKALAKPSISAWAANQLYWDHREEFDQLIALGERFHKAQKSGKIPDMRTALDARREQLTHLSDLATSLLRDAGHTPSPDTIHRITTTLEGISADASRPDGQQPGRLTHDVDPPGFGSFASFVPGITKQEAVGRRQSAGTTWSSIPEPTRSIRSTKSDTGAASARQKEEARKAKIAATKASLQDAKRSLTEARTRAQSLEATQKKADAGAKKAEKLRREAEESLEKAKANLEDAAQRARSIAVEVEEAASALDDAERRVEKTSQELESLIRES